MVHGAGWHSLGCRVNPTPNPYRTQKHTLGQVASELLKGQPSFVVDPEMKVEVRTP